MSSRMVQLQDAQKVRLGDTREAERMGYKVHLAIYLMEVVSCGPMLDEDLDLLDAILGNGANSSRKKVPTIWMFGNYRIPA